MARYLGVWAVMEGGGSDDAGLVDELAGALVGDLVASIRPGLRFERVVDRKGRVSTKSVVEPLWTSMAEVDIDMQVFSGVRDGGTGLAEPPVVSVSVSRPLGTATSWELAWGVEVGEVSSPRYVQLAIDCLRGIGDRCERACGYAGVSRYPVLGHPAPLATDLQIPRSKIDPLRDVWGVGWLYLLSFHQIERLDLGHVHAASLGRCRAGALVQVASGPEGDSAARALELIGAALPAPASQIRSWRP